MSNSSYGVLAEFDSVSKLYHACEKVRDKGFKKWDSMTPFPVHGLDRAMGLPSSRLPWIVLIMGFLGASSGLLMQWWMSAVDYPLVISGKPMFSWPAFIPVTFECCILFSAFGAIFGMFGMNKLPQYYHPVFRSQKFYRVTDDRFFICIECSDPKFNKDETPKFLKELGAMHVETLEP